MNVEIARTTSQVPVMLSIAGSDPSGGAGIQADIKTATALGVYAAAVITSLTAQNTTGVSGVFPIPASFVAEQYVSVVSDLDVRAVKIGMLATAEIAATVAELLHDYPVPAVVLDPVMVATSGDRLVSPETIDVIRQQLLPLATLVTPNLPETAALLGCPVPGDWESSASAARALREMGAAAVLVKGGHLTGQRSCDVLADADGVRSFDAPRVATANTHGTGCTLSSAIASHLAQGHSLREAIGLAKDYLTGALEAGARRRVGVGSGPVDHLWRLGARDGNR
jgi:hydroxymethylpyrimidine/phosphomethylpyrimidine kinase